MFACLPPADQTRHPQMWQRRLPFQWTCRLTPHTAQSWPTSPTSAPYGKGWWTVSTGTAHQVVFEQKGWSRKYVVWVKRIKYTLNTSVFPLQTTVLPHVGGSLYWTQRPNIQRAWIVHRHHRQVCLWPHAAIHQVSILALIQKPVCCFREKSCQLLSVNQFSCCLKSLHKKISSQKLLVKN